MKKDVLMRTNAFICAIIIFGFIVTSLISYHSNRGIFRRDVENVSNLTSEGIYHQIDSIFTKPINISLTMANDSLLKEFLLEELQRGDDADFIQTMRNYLLAYRDKYNYDSVFLVSAETNRYYHFNGLDRTLVKGEPENVWYYTFLESPEEYSLNIDNDEVAMANNEITIFINCKIKNPDDHIMGVVGVGFRINHLQKMFEAYEAEFGVKAYLVDDDGNIQVSTTQTGYEKTNLFDNSGYVDLKERMLKERENAQSFWYESREQKGYVVTQYVPNLDWHLIIENNTSSLEGRLNQQFFLGILVVILVISGVLFTVTSIIRKYNKVIVQLTVEQENKHRSIFQEETEKIYENIYEIDITHNRAASDATESYFESLGVPKNTPYNQAIQIIAEKQIMKKYRQEYLNTFSPENILKAYSEGRKSVQYDFMITSDEGYTYYWMRITTRIFYWDSDKSVRMFVYRQNVDEEKRLENYMFEKMESDSLTGLFNKAATQQYIQRMLTEKTGDSFAFFILDIDNFKTINDTCGHATGDLVIAEFASILKSQFRSNDIVGRIGGDEFVAFLSISSRDWVKRKAEELVSILHHDFIDSGKRCKMSTSIGVAIAPEAGTDFDTLYRNADTALYHTKKQGKDGFTLYSVQAQCNK